MPTLSACTKTIHYGRAHHHVLRYWAAFRRKLRNEPAPFLVTLDHHTDTHQAFLRHCCGNDVRMAPPKPADIQSCARPLIHRLSSWKVADVEDSIRRLRHDEHIDAAEKAGIVDRTFILLTGDGDARSPKQRVHRPRRIIANAGGFPTCDEAATAALTLEPETLDPLILLIENAAGKPLREIRYILDIDMDAFMTERAARPTNETSWHELICRASLITAALEPGCVAGGRLEGEKITGRSLFKIVADHVARV
jgi:hypothetical protein